METIEDIADYYQEMPLLGSVVFYSLAILIGRLSRALIGAHVGTKWQPYLFDAITTFQVMACSLENTHIKEFYGELAYFFILSLLAIYAMLTIREDMKTNPCAHIRSYARGEMGITEVIARSMCQLIGGLLSFPFARRFWRLGLHAGHYGRYRRLHCVADLSLPPHHGFLVEFSATLFDMTMFSMTLTSLGLIEGLIKCCVSSYLVVLGVHLTGMYMNPVNATNQTFGCRGISIPAHLAVYWLAPLLAAAASPTLQRHFENLGRTKSGSKFNSYQSNGFHGNSEHTNGMTTENNEVSWENKKTL